MKKELLLGCLFLALIFAPNLNKRPGHAVTFPPYVSGEIISARKSFGKVLSSTRVLTPDQLKIVAEWLDKHKDGWQPASYKTGRVNERTIVLNEADGQQTLLIFLNRQMVVLMIFKKDADPQAPDGGVQTFPEKEIQPLLDLMSPR